MANVNEAASSKESPDSFQTESISTPKDETNPSASSAAACCMVGTGVVVIRPTSSPSVEVSRRSK